MALTSLTPSVSVGGLADRNKWVYTYTTVGNDYVVMATLNTLNLPIHMHTMVATTNNLVAKIEATLDGTNYFTIVTDMTVAVGTVYFKTAGNYVNLRISVKPAVAATHGTMAWTVQASDVVLADEYRWAFAYESITVSTAKSLTQATYLDATKAVITVEDNDIRVRWDGTAPTAAIGHKLSAGDTIILNFSPDIYHFQAIATGANAVIRVTYSR